MATFQAQYAEPAMQIIKAVAEAIRDLGSVPSGHLYARLMGQLTLSQYNQIIDTLKKAKLVREDNHLLTWIA